MSKRKKAEIHFTTHSCLEGAGAAEAEALVQRARAGECYDVECRDRVYRDAYVRQCCYSQRRRELDERDGFTTLPERVTCRRCLETHLPAQLEKWRSGKGYDVTRFATPADAVFVVWRRCCRLHGARPGAAIAGDLAHRERRALSQAIDSTVATPLDFLENIRRWSHLDRMFGDLGSHEQLPDMLREGIDHLTLAGDLLVEVERLAGLAREAMRRALESSPADATGMLAELDRLRARRAAENHALTERLLADSWRRFDEQTGSTVGAA